MSCKCHFSFFPGGGGLSDGVVPDGRAELEGGEGLIYSDDELVEIERARRERAEASVEVGEGQYQIRGTVVGADGQPITAADVEAPQAAANPADPKIVAMARPPGKRPNHWRAVQKMSRVMPA